MKLKKLMAFMMAAMVALSMTACGNSGSESASGAEETTAAEEQEATTGAEEEDADSEKDAYVIGICQMLEHPAPDVPASGKCR